MSNTKCEMAQKGSKLCIQIAVNNSEVRAKLEDSIGLGRIKWISPLAKDSFKEYQLNDKECPDLKLSEVCWEKFWPSQNQPQWDAIGVTEDDSALILVEAKAHTTEIKGGGCKASEENKEKIMKQIEEVVGKDSVWQGKYYQIANRILFLKGLKEHYKGKKNVYLVFLNFINDVSYISEDENKWKDFYEELQRQHPYPVDKTLKEYIKYVYLNVWK